MVPLAVCTSASRMNRQRLPASTAPQEALPQVPTSVPRLEHQRDNLPSSEVAEYDITQRLLDTERPDPRVDTAEGTPTQIVSNRRVDDDVPSVTLVEQTEYRGGQRYLAPS